MTSSNGNIFRVTGLCAGNSPVTGEFPSQRPVTQRFDVFFDLRLNKRLSKQSRGWWFETPSHSLWRHCNVGSIIIQCNMLYVFCTCEILQNCISNIIPCDILIYTFHIAKTAFNHFHGKNTRWYNFKSWLYGKFVVLFLIGCTVRLQNS